MSSGFLIPWQRGIGSATTSTDDGGDAPDPIVIPIIWVRRAVARQEAVHAYAQTASLDLGIEYVYRIQAQYPWKITSITPAIVSSAISEGRP